MKLRTVIVDDEKLARDRLRRLLGAEAGVEIVAECADGASAVAAIHEHAPDVLLLDVQMPGMDGFAVLRELGGKVPSAVIFVTAFDQHAVRAFEARALDYLLKPTTRPRLAEALARVRERLAQKAPAIPAELLALLAERDAAPRISRIAVRDGGRTVFVAADDIDWVEAAGNYAILHVGKTTHILRETMTALEAELAAEHFQRVSRSAILNLRRVREIQTIAPGEHVALLLDGQRIGITRSLREIEERLRRV